MTDQRILLTDKAIARLRAAVGTQYKVRDSELPGFFVLVGKRRKSFMAQGEFWRDGFREFAVQVKLGDFGEMSTRAMSEARRRMRSDRLPAGNDPARQRRQDLVRSHSAKLGSGIAMRT